MSDLTDEQRTALTAHNDARAQKTVPPLQWDAGLAADAQNYAQVLADTKDFKHSGVDGAWFPFLMSLSFYTSLSVSSRTNAHAIPSQPMPSRVVEIR
jgi:hypothetical protein